MKILELETFGFRHLPDKVWSLTDPSGAPQGMMVVTGPPACGLSSFLEAIAISAARLGNFGASPEADRYVRAGQSSVRIRSVWELDDDEMAYGGLSESVVEADMTFKRGGLGQMDADPGLLGVLGRYSHKPDLAKVMWFPAVRVTNAGFTPIADFEADQRHCHLEPNVEKFAGLPRAIAQLGFAALSGRAEAGLFPKIQSLFGALAPSSRLVGMSPTGHPEFQLRNNARVPLPKLSFSERNAFVFAACTVLMGLDRSVILVDTPELGLTPGVAASWLDLLRGATPNAQWIVASRDAKLVESGALQIGAAS